MLRRVRLAACVEEEKVGSLLELQTLLNSSSFLAVSCLARKVQTLQFGIQTGLPDSQSRILYVVPQVPLGQPPGAVQIQQDWISRERLELKR